MKRSDLSRKRASEMTINLWDRFLFLLVVPSKPGRCKRRFFPAVNLDNDAVLHLNRQAAIAQAAQRITNFPERGLQPIISRERTAGVCTGIASVRIMFIVASKCGRLDGVFGTKTRTLRGAT